ncbi:hypothetical protein BDV37DRAFT_296468 [Aspergillus pseudonomiae]|uniref:FAD/NAD(P)-binding domain-containing protein n=1 Tax=Aspergillus pseudonomiae TaxID=1506151 RepID=A0A5N7DP92_9EURO|nr:uncharacterized protein BDV37DRAFT_296468 [Aspergillus pseudonomiae]KAE8408281.1 hypothetical protein BDV37DRAFT_296468 [Aspergillus pseudonomiae]
MSSTQAAFRSLSTSPDDSNPNSPFISERAIDQPRPLKVVYIGAGISGIIAAIRFIQAVPTLDLVIYEKNPELGGTWYENRYPGCACGTGTNPKSDGYLLTSLDVPSHAYQLSFESWTGWSSFFSGSDEILEYWKRVAKKYDVRKYIQFEKRCTGARWNEALGKWFVQMLDLQTGQTFEDNADVLITGTGQLNEWKWPPIPGLHSFKGKLLHSACWDETYDLKGRNVAVVGGGSSGIQIVPALLDTVQSMDHYIRGKMWICSQLGGEQLAERTGQKGGNFQFTAEEKHTWREDPAAYIRYRKDLEFKMQTFHGKSQRGSKMQIAAQAEYTADMEHRLKPKPELLEQLLPTFPPLCKRIAPGPGYLEALTSPKVNVITSSITNVDATGIIADGKHRPVDAIVCATGFETSPGSGFPILGRQGVNLRQRYAECPETYLGLCTDGFPNFFQSLGPNSFQGAGNLLITIEQTHLYISEILTRMAYDNIGLVEPKRSQVENFTKYAEEYFKRTVYSAECASWYKSSPPGTSPQAQKRGRVAALWPGSSLHAIRALRRVRWEDFEVSPYDGNDFGWFGNGWTVKEKAPHVDDGMTPYLDHTGFVDDVQLEDNERSMY